MEHVSLPNIKFHQVIGGATVGLGWAIHKSGAKSMGAAILPATGFRCIFW